VRRLLSGLGAALALAAGAAVALQPSAQAGGSVRIDVVFDNAQGLIKGQLLQIAGARAGEIVDVKVTRDFKARIQMEVNSKYAPFRKDAQCTIRPQGLIAEYYVNCDPGSPDAPPLQAVGDEVPTVPVAQTTQPVPVTDLFNIWNAPTHQRLGLILNELGITAAGRGQDFNALLRRTNPSLKLARKLIAVLQKQRNDLATILDNTDTVVGKLADNGDRFRSFVDEAAETTAITGARNRQLAEAVSRLPALLAAADPALRDLNTVVDSGTPLVRQLRKAAPSLNQLSADLGPFARQVRPTIKQLGPVLSLGAKTVKNAVPVARLLRSYAHNSLPTVQISSTVLKNLRDRGFAENLLSVFYTGAAATARFDDISHTLPAYAVINNCAFVTTTPVAECSSRYTPAAAAPPATRKSAPGKQADKPAAQAPKAPQAPGTPEVPKPQLPKLPLLPSDPAGTVKDVIDKLLDPIKPVLGGGDDGKRKGLLDYLLG